MEILKQEAITGVDFYVTTIQHPTEGIVMVKDVYRQGKLLDSQYLSKEGYQIEDPALLEEIESFLEV
jgi:hypothetical protein